MSGSQSNKAQTKVVPVLGRLNIIGCQSQEEQIIGSFSHFKGLEDSELCFCLRTWEDSLPHVVSTREKATHSLHPWKSETLLPMKGASVSDQSQQDLAWEPIVLYQALLESLEAFINQL